MTHASSTIVVGLPTNIRIPPPHTDTQQYWRKKRRVRRTRREGRLSALRVEEESSSLRASSLTLTVLATGGCTALHRGGFTTKLLICWVTISTVGGSALGCINILEVLISFSSGLSSSLTSQVCFLAPSTALIMTPDRGFVHLLCSFQEEAE